MRLFLRCPPPWAGPRHARDMWTLRISNIAAYGLPDSDQEMGGGSSDPYIVFTVDSGGTRITGRTRPLNNASRQPTWKRPVIIALPESFSSDEPAMLEVEVWDKDQDDADDLMGKSQGQKALRKGGGAFPRMDIQGHGHLYDFKVGFTYCFESDEPVALPAEAKYDRRASHVSTQRSFTIAEGFRHHGFMEARGEGWALAVPSLPLSHLETVALRLSGASIASSSREEPTGAAATEDAAAEAVAPEDEGPGAAPEGTTNPGHEQRRAALDAARATLRSLERQLTELQEAARPLSPGRGVGVSTLRG
jgi:hypothetical protein